MSKTGLAKHFIRNMIHGDLKCGKYLSVHTRFPPEPNGYLHLGHAKSICLNFALAEEFDGLCNLRFDDTNPEKPEIDYIQSICEDVQWLGYQWHELHYASDYFEVLYRVALQLIDKGLAFVDQLDAQEIREYRGTLTMGGRASPFRERSVAQSRDLFVRMYHGEFAEGAYVLRAKIDMQSSNLVMRDPVLFRIRSARHYRLGTRWHIYPTYDFAHCVCDALEGISHSLCTLEFQDNREMYEWVLRHVDLNVHHPRPRQIEFARLNLQYTVLSKRKLAQLVDDRLVDGWDDPRLPTIAGMRRRGFTASAIRNFCRTIGITKKDSLIELSALENAIRKDLQNDVVRLLGVIRPLKIIITNYPEDKHEYITVKNHPQLPEMGTRELLFSREIYIDRDDFMVTPPADYYSLSPGEEVRLRYGYVITCEEVICGEDGVACELHCTYDPLSGDGKTADGRKISGIIHWVSAAHAVAVEVRLYERLFNVPDPSLRDDFLGQFNPQSLRVFDNAYIEHTIEQLTPDSRFQLERVGYFCFDTNTTQDKIVLNRIVSLRDSR